MSLGYENAVDVRRDDKTLDCSIEIRGRNGEVHLSVSVDGATYGYARVGVDLNLTEANDLVGALKDAAHAAGSSEVVFPLPPSDRKWTPQDVGHVLGERD